MDAFFKPESVVIIGASNSPNNLGAPICNSLRKLGFPGKTCVVNSKGEAVSDCPGYRSVLQVPDPVDLAVILAPARVVPGVMRECGEKGIRSVIVESAGFGELGSEGKRLQQEMDEAARSHGIRFVGPNCIGTMDSHSRFTSFFGVRPGIFDSLFDRPGQVSIVTQSGGVGTLILRSMMSDVATFSKIISIGNKADISESDMLAHLIDDPLTGVIGMYLENISDGRKLCDTAARSTKPIIVYKGGTTTQGARAAVSHTAGMSNNDVIFDNACRQAGMIRLKSVTELYSMPKIFTAMPLLTGRRIAIVTNTGAFGTILADLLVHAGLDPVILKDDLQSRIRGLGTIYNAANPIDFGPGISGEAFLNVFRLLLESDQVDGLVLAINIWQQVIIDAVIELMEMCRQHNKPAAIYTPNSIEAVLRVRKEFGIPAFESPEEAVNALTYSYQHHRHLTKQSLVRRSG